MVKYGLEYITISIFIIYLKLVYCAKKQAISEHYQSFQDPVYEEFGLINSQNKQCLILKFRAKLYNFNLNDTDISTELTDFTSASVKLYGFCALQNEITKKSQIQATWKMNERRKTLKFYFIERFVTRSVNQPDELRWELKEIVFSENYKGRFVSFSSLPNNSTLISAPLHQKFVCKDRVNVTLKNAKYKNIVLEFLPEIDVQPVNTEAGFGSNVYLCDRTRRRTLKESFQSKMTIFSGFILGFSSVSILAGHSFYRHKNLDLMYGYASTKIN